MRACVLGDDVGNGKTITAVCIAYDYLEEGYEIFSNIELSGVFEGNYTFIDGTNFIDLLDDNQSEKVCIFDDIGESTYGFTSSSINFSHVVTQSRKSMGENSHLIFTTPIDNMFNPTIRKLTDYIIYPQIYMKKDLKNPLNRRGIPDYCEWIILKKVRGKYHGQGIQYKKLKPKRIHNLDLVMDCYDTHKEAEKFKTDRTFVKMLNEYQEYIGDKREAKNLASDLVNIEGLTPSEADRIARSIVRYDKEKDRMKIFT